MAFIDRHPVVGIKIPIHTSSFDEIEIVDRVSVEVENEQMIRPLLVVEVAFVDPVRLLQMLPLDLSARVQSHDPLLTLGLVLVALGQQVQMSCCQLLYA